MDAVELLYKFLDSQADGLMDLKNYYAIRQYKPVVTNKNFRFDCGVGAYDNSGGLPPFLPTTLRFEDFGFRMWSAGRPEVATAHANSIQHHMRSPYMRPPLSDEIQNEVIANFLKQKIAGSIIDFGEFGFRHVYDGVVNQKEIGHILKQAQQIDDMIEKSKKAAKSEKRKKTADEMQYGMRYLFNNYEKDVFTNTFSRRIDEENYAIKDCMTYWPRILEISSWLARRGELPMKKVTNKRK
jgi:hypothetical protein